MKYRICIEYTMTTDAEFIVEAADEREARLIAKTQLLRDLQPDHYSSYEDNGYVLDVSITNDVDDNEPVTDLFYPKGEF